MNQEQTNLINEIVEKASAAAVAKVNALQVPKEEEKPATYFVSIKRRWWFAKVYKVTNHYEERVLFLKDPSGNQIEYRGRPRLVLNLWNGRNLVLPNLDSLSFETYY